jgi:hypothetical protein
MSVAGARPNFMKVAPIIFRHPAAQQAARIVETSYSVFQNKHRYIGD